MINRSAIILKYKEKAVRWIHDADPGPEKIEISVEAVNRDNTLYLISTEVGEEPELLERWLKVNFKALFERELVGWYTDPDLWPKRKTRKLFNEWFDVQLCSVIEDTVGTPIYEDEL